MAADPSISTRIYTPPPVEQPDPLTTVGKYMAIQNQANQQQLFQQQFHAKQLMGEIIAGTPPKADGSPDWDSIQQGFLSNPLTAPFAPQAMNEIRQLHLTNTQIAGEEQKQNMTGAQALVKASLAGYNDWKQIGPAMDTYLAAQPQAIQQRMKPVVQAYVGSLTSNLPSDPAAAQKLIQQRIVAHQLALGVTPEVLNGLTGKNQDVDAGDRVVQGVRQPPQMGGGFDATGQVQKGMAPKDVEVTNPVTNQPGRIIIGGQPQGSAVPQGPQGGEMASQGGMAGPQPVPQTSAGPSSGAPGMAGPQPIPGTVGASPMQTEINKQGAEYNKNINENADSAIKLSKLIQFARDAQKNFTPGGGADFKDRIARVGQAAGVPQPMLDQLVNGSQAGKQEFDNTLNTIVFALGRQYVPQGSRFAVAEFENIKDTKPGANWDQRAVDATFSKWQQIGQNTLKEQAEWNKHLADGGQYQQWPQKWNQMQQDSGYTSMDTAKQVGNPQDYKSLSDLQTDYKAGNITKAAAAKIAVQKGWATSGAR